LGIIPQKETMNPKHQIDSLSNGQCLVGGFNPSEKYESVGVTIPNMIYGKINQIFQTTNPMKWKSSGDEMQSPGIHKAEVVSEDLNLLKQIEVKWCLVFQMTILVLFVC
jgi:hypothetical protein